MRDVIVQVKRLLGPTVNERQSLAETEKPSSFLAGRVTRYGFSALGALELKEEGEWVAYAEVQELLRELAVMMRAIEATQAATSPIGIEAIIRRWGFNEEDGR